MKLFNRPPPSPPQVCYCLPFKVIKILLPIVKMPQRVKSELKIVKPKAEKKEDLSEEDKLLIEELDTCVERLSENHPELWLLSLELLRTHIRASTTSMTSVPKPLKFMRGHYPAMKQVYEKIDDKKTKRLCADILSVLAMTMGDNRECLKYHLLGSQTDISQWGHEYVRHLSGEIAVEWNDLSDGPENDQIRAQLVKTTEQIVPYNMQHNAEADACDLLMEIERLDLLEKYIDENTYQRVCLYLHSCVPYVADPEYTILLKTTMEIFRKFKQYPQALRLAMQLNERVLIEDIFKKCPDLAVKKQLACMLARNQMFIQLDDGDQDYDDLIEIMSNAHLNQHFLNLGRELDIMEPKTPEDVYKTHLEVSRPVFGGL